MFLVSSIVTLFALWKILSLKKELYSCRARLYDELETNLKVKNELSEYFKKDKKTREDLKNELKKFIENYNIERKKFDTDQKKFDVDLKKYDETIENTKLLQSKFTACKEKIEQLNNAQAQDYNPEEIKKLFEELNKINEEMEQLTKV